jgi:hypothetical protein
MVSMMPAPENAQIEITTNARKVRELLFGLDLHSWEQWMLVSLGLAALSAVAVVVSTASVVLLQRAETTRTRGEFESYRLEAAKDISGAQERAKVAEQRAAEANLELVRLRTPRSLNAEQQDHITEKIKPFPDISFDFGIVASDQDSVDLLEMIEDALIKGEWRPIPWSDSEPGLQYNRSRSKRVTTGVISARGINILVEPEHASTLLPAAETLSMALNAEGIAARAAADPAASLSNNKTAIHIMIGTKP